MAMMSGFGGFGLVFVIVYLAAVIYFFTLLSSMAKSLKRIADRLDQHEEQRTGPS